VVDVYVPGQIPRCPDWTSTWDEEPAGPAGFVIDDGAETVIVAADGRRIRIAGEERYDDPGQLSPDGSRLALVVERPVPSVAVLDLRTGTRRGYSVAVRDAEVLSWLPSGRRLIYGADAGMFLLDLETGRDDPYDLDTEEPREVAVAPEGARIAVDVGTHIRIAPLAGGAPARIVLPPDAWLGAQGWSPDGRLLAVGREISPSRVPGLGGFDLVINALDTERNFRSVAELVVPGLIAGAFVGWKSMDTVVLLERRAEQPYRLVVRQLDGTETGVLSTLLTPVAEVRCASGLLEKVRTSPSPEPPDLGSAPRWQRVTGSVLSAFRGRR
jgi:hypothetical protein